MEAKKTSKKEVDESKEWPSIKEDKSCKTVVNPELLIMELGRLVPYLEGEDVRFSPINMPNIQIGLTHIIGLIISISCNSKEYDLTVDDATGILEVKYSLKHFDTAQKENQEKAQAAKDSQANKNLLVGDYIHMQGYLALTNYQKTYKNCENPADRLQYGQPIFHAVNVEVITEEQYYKKMDTWLEAAKNRYT